MEYIKIENYYKYNLDKCPSIPCNGSIKGMKSLEYWGKNDKIIKCGNYYYNLGPIK